MEIPDFIGRQYEEVVNDSDYQGLFHFEVSYTIDPDSREGEIVAQSPDVGKSMVADTDGISVKLTVSTGVMTQEIPDVTNMTYQDANLALQKVNFVVELEKEASNTVTEGYVIRTSPAAGETLAAGSTVYVVYSSGPEVQYVTMKNLVGMTESDARHSISTMGLSFGTTSYVYNENYEEGQVVWQSVNAGESVETGTKVYLQVSKGPKGAEESPSPNPAGN